MAAFTVVFYRTDAGNEPVRDWLREMPAEERRIIGEDLKVVQYRWPLGMPLVRKMGPGLWELRSSLPAGIARVFFTLWNDRIVVLHGLREEEPEDPGQRTRYRQLPTRQLHQEQHMKTAKHHPNLGSSLDDFLVEDGMAAEVDAAAIKRMVALQIEDEMKRAHVTKAALARRMRTSRVAVDRLLDTTHGAVTLGTLGRAASALGRRLKVELV